MGGGILVTGASGFVGSSVAAALAADTRTRERVVPAARGAGAGGVILDLRASSIKLPRDIDVVVHLAGEKHSEPDMWAVNFEGTRKLVEAAAVAGVRRFVHLSSVGVYGAPVHSGSVGTDLPHRPANVYEQSKDAAEQLVRSRCVELGIEWVVLQPSNVIGIAAGTGRPLLGLARALARGRLLRFGRRPAVFNYVAVEDVAAAVRHAVTVPSHGHVWIVNTPALVDDALGWMAEELGVRKAVPRVPELVGEVMVRLAAPLAALAGRNPPIDRARLRELTNTTRYDGQAICRGSGFVYPVGAERLLRTLTARYREKGLL